MSIAGITFKPEDVLKNLLNNPVQAIVSMNQYSDLKVKSEAVKAEIKAKTALLDTLVPDISSYLDSKVSSFGLPDIKELVDKIRSFTDSAVTMYKGTLSESMGKNLSEIENAANQEKEKAIKAIESYFLSFSLPPDTLKISMKLVNGSYDGRASYRIVTKYESSLINPGKEMKKKQNVVEDISLNYEFSLRTADLDLFSSILTFSTLYKGFKLPVRFASTWASKEPAVDFEKIDKYYLAEADLSDKSLTVIFRDDEKAASAKFSLTTYEDNTLLGAEYSDSSQTVDIMNQHGLTNALDVNTLTNVLKLLFTTFLEMEKHKLRLTKLLLDDNDILASLDLPYLLIGLCKIVVSRINALKLQANEFDPIASLLTGDYTMDRLKLLGDLATPVSKIIGIDSSRANS
ncbi:MAG: hypothetical protein ACP5NK_01965 [Thermoplasmata archaeon]